MCLKQSHQELEVHKDRALYLYLQFYVCQARYIQSSTKQQKLHEELSEPIPGC